MTLNTKNSTDLYRQMLRIRMVEEAIADRYIEQDMRCPVHLSIGQEAVAVGVCSILSSDDIVTSNHRNHAHYLAKGGSLRSMIAELYGKESGCARGRGGSMHLLDGKAGVIAALPIVGSSIPLGVGAALSFVQRQEDRVAIVFFGDAAIEEGVFHESANFAAVHKLPVVFVCENNLYSVYTPLYQRQPDRPLSEVAKAHAIPSVSGDGNVVEEVSALATSAVRSARNGDGPVFLEFSTYRWREHCGPNYDNNIGYRTEEEFLNWRAQCPVTRFHELLEKEGKIERIDIEAIEQKIVEEIDDAFKFAKSSPFPAPDAASQYVYALSREI